jgi:hypothetical protein
MKKLIHSIVATALCAVALGPVAAPSAHAAAAKVVYSAHLEGDPGALIVGIDGAKNVDVNKLTDQLNATFEGTDWNIMDNGTIVVTKSGKTVTTLPFQVASEDLSVIFPHARAATSGVDGLWLADEAGAFMIVWITQPASGGSFTFTMIADLSL